ncbi:MAG: caspase family protein, partial [Cyanobacteria bacterium P01_D01_bin.6]
MANQWALLIGINQYKALQPLMYAQPDAVELRNFLVDELGVPVDHCTLLTDLSAAIEPHAYMPLRQEIEHQLQTLCRDRVQPGDLLWVFFSGCGLTEASQDYWMTLDSEPINLPETAISISDIFNTLSQAKTDQIVLAIDMNRSQGAVGHRDIGAQTLTLAQDYGITTFLSCQPEQFSHETMYIR